MGNGVSYDESESNISRFSDFDFSFLGDLSDGFNEMSENEENDKERQLKAAFADWAVTGRVKYTHVTMVLHVLHFFLPFLPKDSRTLLKTMHTVSEGYVTRKYYHFGIKQGCQKAITSTEATSVITLFVNVGGLPLTKSTNNQLWPIVGRIVKPARSSPFTIGTYHGAKDPKIFNEFLEDLVVE